jgi:hypothetical protein
MEVFTECLVKKQSTTKDTLLKLLIILGAVVLSIAAFLICSNITVISFLGIFFVAGIIYGGWVLLKSFSVEYEYILTNSDLDVDKITSQSRRKRLTTIDLKNIELMAPVKESYRREYENESIAKKIDASTGNTATEYFIKYSSTKTGVTLLRFNPDDRIIKGARQFSPRKVFEA